ncbi:hypothetical protein BGZ99_006897, partial [Dissophora globulifera]
CGLSRRRAISRRNGGYQSSGTTNTTDLRQVERDLESAAENGEASTGGRGFGDTSGIKVTPAMASIPIVMFRKPPNPTASSPPGSKGQERAIVEQKVNFESSSETVKGIEESKEIKASPTATIQSDSFSQEPSRPNLISQTCAGGSSDSGAREDRSIAIDIDNPVSSAQPHYPSVGSSTCVDGSYTDKKELPSTDTYPMISDEECAICLFDFEDGDELRHLYCDHFFHRACVDRWLAKHPFCPKCKRGI